MAGICIVCKSSLESPGEVVSLRSAINHNPSSNAFGFNSEPLFCHRHCFICSVCSATLDEKWDSCGVSIEHRLYCKTHFESSQNDALIQALKSFKARSLALKEALQEESVVSDFQDESSFYSRVCACSEPKYVQRVRGYYSECTEKECPQRDSFTKSHENRFKSYCDLGSTRISGHAAASVAPDDFYRHFFYGVKHWNFCTREEDIGFVLITFRPEASPHSKGYSRWVVKISYCHVPKTYWKIMIFYFFFFFLLGLI